MENENKQRLCNMLCRLYRATRAGGELVDLAFDEQAETVTALFDNGAKRVISVIGDSGAALIADVVNHLKIV